MKLELLEIPNPCSVPWDSMAGDARVRHCLHCHLDVYDLSALTREEAERFLETREGACVTMLKRHDGTVVTQDCAPQRDTEPHSCPVSDAAPNKSAGAPRPLAPAPAAPPAPAAAPPPAPAAAPPRAPAAAPRPAPPPPAPPPPIRLGGAPPPSPTPAIWEAADPRVGRGTLLADLVRAIRAAMPDDGDRRVREVERALELPANWKTASCSRAKCPLWIPGGTDPVPPDFLTPRTELLAVLEPVARAAFGTDRSDVLLREVRRTAFAGTRGACPHCHEYIGLPRPSPTL